LKKLKINEIGKICLVGAEVRGSKRDNEMKIRKIDEI
jgi:hypothetical protein